MKDEDDGEIVRELPLTSKLTADKKGGVVRSAGSVSLRKYLVSCLEVCISVCDRAFWYSGLLNTIVANGLCARCTYTQEIRVALEQMLMCLLFSKAATETRASVS